MPFVILKYWYYIIIIPLYYKISYSLYVVYDVYVNFSNIQLYYVNIYEVYGIVLYGFFPSACFTLRYTSFPGHPLDFNSSI